MNSDIKWAARLSHVREVSLRGAADLPYWTAKLAPENLTPLEQDGRAQVLVIASDARFRGIPFREISFSISVVPPDPSFGPEAAYLLRAYNSSRFFAWCERTFFSTPYSAGDLRVTASPAASVQLMLNRQTAFHATMQPTPTRTPSYAGDGGWEGPILLPRAGRAISKHFFARIRGRTRSYPFVTAADTLLISPPPHDDALAALRDSHFAPIHWEIRDEATHAKSKTYPTASLPHTGSSDPT